MIMEQRRRDDSKETTNTRPPDVEHLRLVRSAIGPKRRDLFSFGQLTLTILDKRKIPRRRRLVALAKRITDNQPVLRQVTRHGHIPFKALVRPVGQPLGRLYGRCVNIQRAALDPVMFEAAPEYPAVHFPRTFQTPI